MVAIAALIGISLWWFTSGRGSGAEQSTGQAVASAPASSAPSSAAPTGTDPESGLPWVTTAELPPEALDTLAVIDAGPPYPYDRDGITFENREGLLPQEDTGYYEEFTVETPGSSDRGARRIISGLGDEYYYTGDHYASFSRIAR